MAAGRLIRHTRDHPCPVCGGWPTLPRRQTKRCAGMTGEHLVWCTREEYAGHVPFDSATSPGAFRHQRYGWCPCGHEHGHELPHQDFASSGFVMDAIDEAKAHEARATASTTPAIDPELQHELYQFLLGQLSLRTDALADLTRRGLDLAAIGAAGYRSIPATLAERKALLQTMIARFGEAHLRPCPGFENKNHELFFWHGAGFVVPYLGVDGRITGLQCKLLGGKYLTAGGARLAFVYHLAGHLEAGANLYLTEGGLKAQVAAHLGGIAAFGLAGQTLAPEHIAVIKALAHGRVIVCLDQEDNAATDRMRATAVRALVGAGIPTCLGIWEGADLGGPKGIDDLYQAGGRPRLRRQVITPPELTARRVPLPTEERGAVTGGLSLAEARTRTRAAIYTFMRR